MNSKTYEITVNDKTYVVKVKEVAEGTVTSSPAPTTQQPVSSNGEQVVAPMPGNILSVNVSVGDKVTKGTLLCILEAMKMENEIVAPIDGVITKINVNKGDQVESGTLLIVM